MKDQKARDKIRELREDIIQIQLRLKRAEKQLESGSCPELTFDYCPECQKETLQVVGGILLTLTEGGTFVYDKSIISNPYLATKRAYKCIICDSVITQKGIVDYKIAKMGKK